MPVCTAKAKPRSSHVHLKAKRSYFKQSDVKLSNDLYDYSSSSSLSVVHWTDGQVDVQALPSSVVPRTTSHSASQKRPASWEQAFLSRILVTNQRLFPILLVCTTKQCAELLKYLCGATFIVQLYRKCHSWVQSPKSESLVCCSGRSEERPSIKRDIRTRRRTLEALANEPTSTLV